MSGKLHFKNYKACIFDWDNTLISNWPALLEAYNATLKHYGHAHRLLSVDDEHVMGVSLKDQFPQIFGDQWEEAATLFRGTFGEIHLDHVKPVNGAEAFLKKLYEIQMPCFVVSNKMGSFLKKECENLGWSHYFKSMVGAGDASDDKPSRAPVDMALEGSGITANRDVLFIGDMNVDVETSHNAGLTSVLIRSKGYEGGREPHYVFDHIEELMSFIA